MAHEVIILCGTPFTHKTIQIDGAPVEVLLTPDQLSEEQVARIKERWAHLVAEIRRQRSVDRKGGDIEWRMK